MADDTATVEAPTPPAQSDELSSQSRAPASDVDLMRDLGSIKSRELDDKTKTFAQTEQRMESDRAYMQDRMKASGLEADKLKPWNQEEEQKKFEHSPLEAFGSLGSVFGILASAFTHAPMENALNASAGAMNAIKANDDKAFERAYTAWKDNMKLVETRHKMIQDGFHDAESLMRTDMAAGTVKAQNLATRYGDEQSLLLLNNGMSKEFFELQSSRAKAMEGIVKANSTINETTMRQQLFDNALKQMPEEEQKKNPAKVMAMWNYYHGMNTKPEEDMMAQYWAEHPKATLEDAAAFVAKHKADQKAGATGPGGNANLTPDRIRAQSIAKYKTGLESSIDPETGEPYSAEKVGEMVAKYDKKLKTEGAAISGNQADKITGMIDQTKYFEGHLDAAENLLVKHKALTGLGGKLLRPAEALSNVFGSNGTDRKQFEREIAGAQELASRVLTGSAGRPLAAEASKINTIVAGLQMGDTTANTMRAIQELRPLIRKIREDLNNRKGGSAPNSSEPAKDGASKPKWMNAPIVEPAGKRSDAGANDNVALRGNISDEVETGSETVDVPPGADPRDYLRRRTG